MLKVWLPAPRSTTPDRGRWSTELQQELLGWTSPIVPADTSARSPMFPEVPRLVTDEWPLPAVCQTSGRPPSIT